MGGGEEYEAPSVLREASDLIALFASDDVTDDRKRLVTKQEFDSIMDRLAKHDNSNTNNKHNNSNRRGDYGGVGASDLCWELLQILERSEMGILQPDIVSYNFVLQSFAAAGKAREADELLQSLLQTQSDEQEDSSKPFPTSASFHSVIHAYARAAATSTAGYDAERIFAQMEALDTLSPDSRTLAMVMEVWAQSEDSQATARIEVMLDTVLDRRQRQLRGDFPEHPGILPTAPMFHAAIQAWSGKGRAGAENAQSLLRRMQALDGTMFSDAAEADEVAPTTRTYALVLNAWAESKDTETPSRCRELLEEMMRLYRENGEERIRPNAHCFAICIKALAKDPPAAQQLWDAMVELYRVTQNEDLKPNLHAAGTVITAWARNRSVQQRNFVVGCVEQVLGVLEEFEVALNTETLNGLLNVFAKHGHATKARELLQSMESENIADIISYNTVLDALSNAKMQDSAGEAWKLLERMEAPDFSVTPDKFTYTSVITAFSKSLAYNKASRAKGVLERMMASPDCKPDAVAFTAVLSACANTTSPKHCREALKIALQTFEEMKEYPKTAMPNQRTYLELLKACSTLSKKPAERIRLLGGVFEKCCNDGMLGKLSVAVFRKGVPKEVQKKFGLENDNHVVPASWCENVAKRDRPNNR